MQVSHCFWHWSFSRQLGEAGADWSSALLISSYHPASLSLCLNYDFRGFPAGAAHVFLCHPPLSFQLHIPASVWPCWQSRFLHSPPQKKEISLFVFFYFSSVWKELFFPGIPSRMKMCWLQRLRCPARGPVGLSVKMRKHLRNLNCGILLWKSVFIFRFL